MSHELNVTADGRASMAYIGQTPWHGLGQVLTPGAPLEDWQREAGLDWEAKRTNVQFQREFDKPTHIPGADVPVPSGAQVTSKDHNVLYRSDTGNVLSIVSPRYQVVQPKQIIEFYRDLVERHGFEMETAGCLKDGKKVWALANTKNVMSLRGKDDVKGYLLLATSYDGTMATQARFTSIRVVCNNTLTFATSTGKANVTVPHNTEFKADDVKIDLEVGDAWEAFAARAHAMSERVVSQDESVKFFLDAYYGLSTTEAIREARDDEKTAAKLDKFMEERMTKALFNSPGAHMASAKGLLWGLVNAVTYDVDHAMPAHNQGNRLNSAWFGKGEVIKQRAWSRALEMIA